MSALSKAWVCCGSLAGIAGSSPAGVWMSVCCECCVLLGRGLCDGPIPRPKESYRVCVCVIECDQVQQVTLHTCNEQVWRGQTECSFQL